MPLEAVKHTTTIKKLKSSSIKYFLGENSGFNFTLMENLSNTGLVTKEAIERVLINKDTILSDCNGNSLVIATPASNTMLKNVGYFSANNGRELSKKDIPEAYKTIKNNINDLILAVSIEDFIESW